VTCARRALAKKATAAAVKFLGSPSHRIAPGITGLTHTGDVVEPLPATIRRQASNPLGKARIAPRPAGPPVRGTRILGSACRRCRAPAACGLSLGIPENRREAPMLGEHSLTLASASHIAHNPGTFIPGQGGRMPLDREVKSALRDKVSLANKSNVADVMEEVQKARATLPEDDKDFARLGGWLEDLQAIAGGGVIGKSS
jgi:hypothetical protein